MQSVDIAIETIPVGPLGIITMNGITEVGNKVDKYLSAWRSERESEHKENIIFTGYEKDSYIIRAEAPRFSSGEAKGLLKDSVKKLKSSSYLLL